MKKKYFTTYQGRKSTCFCSQEAGKNQGIQQETRIELIFYTESPSRDNKSTPSLSRKTQSNTKRQQPFLPPKYSRHFPHTNFVRALISQHEPPDETRQINA